MSDVYQALIPTDFILILSTSLIAATSIIVTAIEDLSIPRKLFQSSIFDWKYALAFQPLLRPPRKDPFFDSLFSAEAFKITVFTRLIGITLFIASLFVAPQLSWLFASLILLSFMYLFYRLPYSLDGSDQMTLFVVIGLFVMSFGYFNDSYYAIGAFIIWGQTVLSYATSGIAKLFGPLWRNGKALQEVLSSAEFGNSKLGRFFTANPKVALLGTWCVMLAHIVVASAYVLGGPFTLVSICVSLFFHIAVAMFMRLNVFVYAFSATYPAMLYFSDIENRNIFIGILGF